MKSFLMMGQSNMAGRGIVSSVEPIRNKNCFMLRNGLWRPMIEPINVDRQVTYTDPIKEVFSGVGPAASFADSWAKFYGEDIGLIPCADGGTSLHDWRIDGQLFLNAFYQAKLAMNTSTLAGIIWHQGEGDCGTMELASSYAERFTVMMDEFQKRLGVSLPIVVGELGEFLVNRFSDPAKFREVNRQLNLLAEHNPKIACASSAGLEDKGDNLHFSARAAREFGCRYFEAYQTIEDK